LTLPDLYQQALTARGYRSDPAQLAAIDELARFLADYTEAAAKGQRRWMFWRQRPALRGVYMHGGVGRGKSFLMDLLMQALPGQRKLRLHFHEFMREVHRELHGLQGTVNPLQALGQRMAKRVDVLCFDEFHVADVTDAMILHRLLQALFDEGVSMITTSNFHPDDLYPNGLHRDRILPAIELLKSRMQVVSVDAGTDYRQQTLDGLPMYLTPLNDAAEGALTAAFDQLRAGGDEDPVLHVEGRELRARRRADGVVWFDFKALCGAARSQNDYLEIASRFHTVLLSGVPQLEVRHASEARRLTWLIDVLYDRRVKLMMSAAVAPEALYRQGPMAHEFPRTVSRLTEMQGHAYLHEARRRVDTRLT
jgi:cell division protein ZapE